MKITTRLRAKIHVYDALVTLIDDVIRFPGDWLDGELKTSEVALVREVASDLLTEMERRLDRAKAKIKPRTVARDQTSIDYHERAAAEMNADGHKFVSQGKCSCGFEVGDEPNGPCPFKT